MRPRILVGRQRVQLAAAAKEKRRARIRWRGPVCRLCDQTKRLTRFSRHLLAARLRLRVDVRRDRRIGDRRERRALGVDLLARARRPTSA